MLILRLFLFFLPLQFALSPVEGIDLPLARVLSVAICIGWFVWGMWRLSIRIQLSLQSALFLSLWFFLGISVFFANEISWAWRKLFFLVSFLPLYFVFLEQLSGNRYRSIILARSFVLGAFFSAFIGCIQVGLQFFVSVETLFAWWTKGILPFFLGEAFSAVVAEYPSILVNLSGVTVMRASALFPDPHMHAFFLGLSLPLAVFFAWYEKKVLWKWIAGVILMADLLTFSRGAYLGLACASLGFSLYYLLSYRKISVCKLFVGISFVVIFCFFPNPVMHRFWSSFSEEDGSVSARLSLYEEAVTHIGERPWIGAGLGNYPLIVKPSADRRDPIYVHNLWLDLMVEIGIIGTLFFLLFFFRTVWASYAQGKQGEKSFQIAVFCALLIFFGHSLVENPLFSVQVLPVFLFILALGNTSYDDQ